MVAFHHLIVYLSVNYFTYSIVFEDSIVFDKTKLLLTIYLIELTFTEFLSSNCVCPFFI